MGVRKKERMNNPSIYTSQGHITVLLECMAPDLKGTLLYTEVLNNLINIITGRSAIAVLLITNTSLIRVYSNRATYTFIVQVKVTNFLRMENSKGAILYLQNKARLKQTQFASFVVTNNHHSTAFEIALIFMNDCRHI